MFKSYPIYTSQRELIAAETCVGELFLTTEADFDARFYKLEAGYRFNDKTLKNDLLCFFIVPTLSKQLLCA